MNYVWLFEISIRYMLLGVWIFSGFAIAEILFRFRIRTNRIIQWFQSCKKICFQHKHCIYNFNRSRNCRNFNFSLLSNIKNLIQCNLSYVQKQGNFWHFPPKSLVFIFWRKFFKKCLENNFSLFANPQNIHVWRQKINIVNSDIKFICHHKI